MTAVCVLDLQHEDEEDSHQSSFDQHGRMSDDEDEESSGSETPNTSDSSLTNRELTTRVCVCVCERELNLTILYYTNMTIKNIHKKGPIFSHLKKPHINTSEITSSLSTNEHSTLLQHHSISKLLNVLISL